MTVPLRARAQWRAKQLRKRFRAEAVRAELRGRWYFRHAERLGSKPFVIGHPLVTTAHLEVGDELLLWSIHRQTHLGGFGRLELGDRVFINSGAVILAFDRISIGDDVAIASEVFLSDSDNHALADRPMRQAPIVIGEGAWVATRAIVLAGVNIGPRAVVAAGSVVTGDVPAETLVAGVPARPVRKIEYPPGKRTAWRDE